MRNKLILICIYMCVCTVPLESVAQPLAATKKLSLNQVLERVYQHSPSLWKLRQEQSLWPARILQAGLGTNFEVSLESEDFVGSAAFTPDQFTQFTLRLGRTVVMGDKLGLRVRLAHIHQNLMYWDYRVQLQELGVKTYLAYCRLLNTQTEQRLLKELRRSLQETHALMTRGVAAGKFAPTMLLQSELELKNMQAEEMRLELQARSQTHELAVLWGGSFDEVPLTEKWPVPELPPLKGLEQKLPQHPRLARWETESQHRKTALDAAQSQALPDINVSGGIRFHAPQYWGGLLLLSMPIPLDNQNQGNVQEANLRYKMWHTERSLEQQMLVAQLKRAYQLTTDLDQMIVLLDEQIALAQRQWQTALKLFDLGKTGYIGVLNASQNLFRLRRQRLSVQGERLLALVEVLGYTQPLLIEKQR